MKQLRAILEWLKGSFTKNMGMKIGSLVFAFLLWCYVATNENPIRTRTLTSVPVTYVGAEDLQDRALSSARPLADVLNTVNITVQVETQYLQNTTSDLIQATVDLSGITEPGEYTLPVSVSTNANFITITGVVPSNVTLSIEESAEKEVPVEVQLTGTENPDLYYGAPRLSQSTIKLTGPRTAIEQAARAICTVDIGGLDQSITATHTLTLVDGNGDEIPLTSFDGVPAVIVEVPIFPTRTLELNVDRIRNQISGVASGYEITEVSVNPKRVEIAGPQEAIDAVTTIGIESIVLDDATESVTLDDIGLLLPDDVYTSIPDSVEIEITIAAIQTNKNYPGVDIEIKNLAEGLAAVVQPEAIDVTASGSATQLDQINATQILPFVDLAEFGIGTYEVPIKFENEGDLGVELTPSVESVTVVIRRGTQEEE